MEQCPQCKINVTDGANRIVQDACGHKKCRTCLLNDELSCYMCLLNQNNGVIKYEENPSDNIKVNQDQQSNKKESKECNKVVLPSHITIVSTGQYKCSVCSKEFNSKSNIKYHKYCVGGKKPFCCDICKKEFIAKSHYNSHILIHTETKPYECGICKKGFTQKSKLNRHLSLHSNEKTFTCQECGKTFQNKEYLKNHLIIHKDEKPYACNQCDSRFNNSSNLKKHLASHSSEKAHMCDQCGKRFKLKWALTVHRRSHSAQRPHKCSNCNKAFINLKDLQRHRLIHADTKTYACGVCMTSFRRKDNLERHVRNTHPGKKVTHIKKVENKDKEIAPDKSIVEKPNAINVITSSSVAQEEKKEEKPLKQINAPLKLAFKTSAFKSCYNIHRDIEPQTDNINIYQKILLPNSTNTNELNKTDSSEKAEIPLKSFTAPPINYETSFEHKTHAIIKNIKFKLPSHYTNLKNEMNKKSFCENLPGTNSTDLEQMRETSVIVNATVNKKIHN